MKTIILHEDGAHNIKFSIDGQPGFVITDIRLRSELSIIMLKLDIIHTGHQITPEARKTCDPGAQAIMKQGTPL